MTPRSRWLILGFSLAGLAFAGASTYVHYKLRVDPTYISPCDLSSTFNCTNAYLSEYGAVWGIPVALAGLAWFALVALVAGFSRPVRTPQEATMSGAGGYLFVLATIGLASIFYLGYASFFKLKTACVLCIGTYVSVAGIFVVAGLANSIAMTQLPARLFRDIRSWAARPLVLIAALLFVGGTVSAVSLFPKEGYVAPAQEVAPDLTALFKDAWAKQPRINLSIPADGADVVVVKFNDWLCPGCKAMHYAYKPLFDKYAKSDPGKIKYVVKDWPWNSKCNFNAGQSLTGHEGSCEAAAAVRMAADRGKADAMIEWLFNNQEMLTGQGMGNPKAPDQIKAQAATMLGVKDFDREYAAKLPLIQKDVADGGAVQLGSTPLYFVNGVRCTDEKQRSLPPDIFDLALQIELKKLGVK